MINSLTISIVFFCTLSMVAAATGPFQLPFAFACGFGKQGAGSKKKSKKSTGVSTTAPRSSAEPELQRIPLGTERSVQIWVPPNELEDNPNAVAQFSKRKKKGPKRKSASTMKEIVDTFRGRGNVIWPSSLHLARLIANCPSFVEDKRVFDLGCGLGLTSLAALLGKPSSVTMCDDHGDVLERAERSCRQQLAKESSTHSMIHTMKLDWSKPESWDQAATFGMADLVLASDVLYDEEAADHVALLLCAQLMWLEGPNSDGKRAIIVDPIQRENRDAFTKAVGDHGWDAQSVPFPGQEDEFVLINVTPKA